MANALYDKGREAFLNGQISWGNDDIRAILVDTTLYTVNLATHQYLSSVPGNSRKAVSSSFIGKSVAAGVADATDVTFSAVSAGNAIQAMVIYKHTGNDATAALIAYIDSATGLPVTPNGGDITATFDNGNNRIFKL